LEKDFDCCDKCPSCLKIDKDQHPDVHVIDSEGAEIKIECIRQLQSQISFKPYEGKKKVFIIKNAHNLNVASSNAFLKTLEESPGESLIILVSEKPSLLLKTIISRCQLLKFNPLARPELEEILTKDYSLESGLAHFLAYFCEGRLGHALRLKDTQILREKNRIIDEFVFSRRQSLEKIPVQNREETRNYLNILTSWFRDMYLIKIGMPHSELINLDRKAELLKSMPQFSFLDLDEILNSISDSLFYLDQNINIKLLKSNLKAELWRG
jgi:DNA polymerase-3 subunit delta'